MAHELTHTVQQGAVRRKETAQGAVENTSDGTFVGARHASHHTSQPAHDTTTAPEIAQAVPDPTSPEIAQAAPTTAAAPEIAQAAPGGQTIQRSFFNPVAPLVKKLAKFEVTASSLWFHTEKKWKKSLLKRGTIVEVQKIKKDSWVWVVANGERGYLHKGYIKPASEKSKIKKRKPADLNSQDAYVVTRKYNRFAVVSNDGQKEGKPGVNLHSAPEASYQKVGWLPYNQKVFVTTQHPGGWVYVTTPGGLFGYIDQNYINMNMPEPNARLHRVKSGETALSMAQKFFKGHIKKGQDKRFFTNVLLYLNRGKGNSKKGIFTHEAGASWEEAKTTENTFIWIPSTPYALGLKGTISSGSTLRDMVNSIEAFVKRNRQRTEDFQNASILSRAFFPEYIKEIAKTVFSMETLQTIGNYLLGAVIILAITTLIGAAIGFFFAGAGAGAGAVLGFEVGMFILKWLGIAAFVGFILSTTKDIASHYSRFIQHVWDANGNKEAIIKGANELAMAQSTLLATIFLALLSIGVRKGVKHVWAKIQNTNLAKIADKKLFSKVRTEIDKIKRKNTLKKKEKKGIKKRRRKRRQRDQRQKNRQKESKKNRSKKQGRLTIDEGVDLSKSEKTAAEFWLNQGYDVRALKPVQQTGVRTADFEVQGIGRVDIYSPLGNTTSNRIVSAILKKNNQAGTVHVEMAKDSILSVSEISRFPNRIFGHPLAGKSIQKIVVRKNGTTIINEVRR